MTERPILFSGAMVRAILEGRKTVTRRAIKHQPDVPVTDAIPRRDYPHGPATVDWYWRPQHGHLNGVPSHGWDFKCPYGEPGDRLWVRETWACVGNTDPGYLVYRATYPACLPPGLEQVPADIREAGYRWRPSIHMPRANSRILLEITAVRVERLQDITRSDIRAEGLVCPPELRSDDVSPNYRDWYPAAWRELWESINGPDSWTANPWVWVVEFKRVKP